MERKIWLIEIVMEEGFDPAMYFVRMNHEEADDIRLEFEERFSRFKMTPVDSLAIGIRKFRQEVELT